MSHGILNKDYLQFITAKMSLLSLDCAVMEIQVL